MISTSFWPDARMRAAAALGDRLVRRAPPPDAELRPVVAAEQARQIVVPVQARLIRRPDVAAVGAGAIVEVALIDVAQPLNGGELGRVIIENEPRVVEAVLAVEQQLAVHGPLVLRPVVLVRCGLASRRRKARRRARPARTADLVVAVEEER